MGQKPTNNQMQHCPQTIDIQSQVLNVHFCLLFCQVACCMGYTFTQFHSVSLNFTWFQLILIIFNPS